MITAAEARGLTHNNEVERRKEIENLLQLKVKEAATRRYSNTLVIVASADKEVVSKVLTEKGFMFSLHLDSRDNTVTFNISW